jgi:hypothetical protein
MQLCAVAGYFEYNSISVPEKKSERTCSAWKWNWNLEVPVLFYYCALVFFTWNNIQQVPVLKKCER